MSAKPTFSLLHFTLSVITFYVEIFHYILRRPLLHFTFSIFITFHVRFITIYVVFITFYVGITFHVIVYYILRQVLHFTSVITFYGVTGITVNFLSVT